MKRICYLLLWFLTGFSIAVNENGDHQTHLLSNFEKVRVLKETEETRPSPEAFFAADEPERTAKPKRNLIPATNLISSVKR